MKTAGVRELKAHLSAYLRDVGRGEVFLVTDNGQVVAELRPPGPALAGLSPRDLRFQKLIERGVLRAPTHPADRSWAGPCALGVSKAAAASALDAERGE
jgi:antitoxin (DNA-binding transcriptional repressor) of toxin-antitoxin stability system